MYSVCVCVCVCVFHYVCYSLSFWVWVWVGTHSLKTTTPVHKYRIYDQNNNNKKQQLTNKNDVQMHNTMNYSHKPNPRTSFQLITNELLTRWIKWHIMV